jgi:hypothetical protein
MIWLPEAAAVLLHDFEHASFGRASASEIDLVTLMTSVAMDLSKHAVDATGSRDKFYALVTHFYLVSVASISLGSIASESTDLA